MGSLVISTWLWVLSVALLGAVIVTLAVIRRSAATARAQRLTTGAADVPDSPGVDEPAVNAAPVVAGKYAGSAEPTADGSAPAGYEIKGNEDSKLFHTDESPYYRRTRVQVWFDTEDNARAAGFARWNDRPAVETEGPATLPSVAEGAFGPGSADPLEDGEAPDGFSIKANADSMLFHTDKSPFYARIRAEVWFSSEEAARAAGFTRWDGD
jgi:hypothetical protein